MNMLLAFIVALSAFVLMSATTHAQQYLRHTVEWGETVYSIPVLMVNQPDFFDK